MRNCYSEYLYLVLAAMCLFFLFWESGSLDLTSASVVLLTMGFFVGLYIMNRKRRIIREGKKADEMAAIRKEELSKGGLLEEQETWKF